MSQQAPAHSPPTSLTRLSNHHRRCRYPMIYMPPAPIQLKRDLRLDQLEHAVDDLLSQRMNHQDSLRTVKSNILFGTRVVKPFVNNAVGASDYSKAEQAPNCSMGLAKRTNRTYTCCIQYRAKKKKKFIEGKPLGFAPDRLSRHASVVLSVTVYLKPSAIANENVNPRRPLEIL